MYNDKAFKFRADYIVIIFLLLILSCSNKNTPLCEKEIYLLPDDFSGIVMVFFNQEDGSVCEYQGDSRLYRIPQDGLFKTQFAANGGCMVDDRVRFFYEDSIGQRKEIAYFLNIGKDEIPLDKNYVMLTFLPDKKDSLSFAIHLVGEVKEFTQLTNAVKRLKPYEILRGMGDSHTGQE